MNVSELLRRIRYFAQRDRVTRELEEEMRMHVEMRAERMRATGDASTALHSGETFDPRNDPAYAAARRQFGNTTTMQQRSREMWGFANVEELIHDLKFALRRLVKRRALSASVIGVMAIGIGAVTAMFSAVDAAMLRPLPFKEPDRLVVLPNFNVPFDPGMARTGGPARTLDVTDVRQMTNLFTDVAAFGTGGANLVDAEHPTRVKVGAVTTNFFSTLGIAPFRGRAFVDAEGVANGPDVVILSYGLWQRQYGGRDISGMHLVLGTRTYEVIGVMPQGFTFPEESDLWVPQSVPYTFATAEIFSRI